MTDHINLGGIGGCQDLVDKVADFSGTGFQMVDGSKEGDAGLTTVGECKDAVPVLDQSGCDEGVPGFFGQQGCMDLFTIRHVSIKRWRES